MKRNFHTHTTRCQHAKGTDEQYVQAAIEGGLQVLGFSDHAPFPFPASYKTRFRMDAAEWPDYAASIRGLKDRYAGQIEIHLGVESEWFPRYRDHMLHLRDDGCEYFILGQHFVDSEECSPAVIRESVTREGLMRYAESTVEAIRTGLFCYLAHPDLFMRNRREFDKDCENATDLICQAAKEAGIPIEYNLQGLSNRLTGSPHGYPNAAFWKYARKWDNDVILGVDAHDPAALSNIISLWRIGVQRLEALDYRIVEQFTVEQENLEN